MNSEKHLITVKDVNKNNTLIFAYFSKYLAVQEESFQDVYKPGQPNFRNDDYSDSYGTLNNDIADREIFWPRGAGTISHISDCSGDTENNTEICYNVSVLLRY